MPLNIPGYFEAEIQGKDTNLVPLVVIGESLNPANLIIMSTTEWSRPSYIAKPLLLNIPSLKESIDIEKRNYKISSLNIDISNFPYEGVRFSERVDNLINQPCRIFWASPSTAAVLFENNPLAGALPANAFQMYLGTIRRYTHDDEKVRLVVEDKSQATLHRDLPTAELGADNQVPDKYKNKPIPMVYGHVDRSPCVVDTGKIIKIDSQDITGLVNNSNDAFNEETSPLLISVNDSYLPVLKTIEANLGSMVAGDPEAGDEGEISLSAEGSNQWVDPGIEPSIALLPNLLVNNNVLQCKLFHKPVSIDLGKYDSYDINLT